MFVYYEHHKDATGKVILTELRLSSYGDGTLALNKKSLTEETLKTLCLGILKWPPIDCRSYDEKSVVWSYWGQYGIKSTYGEEILNKLHAVCRPIQELVQIPVQNLAAQALNHRVDMSTKKRMTVEEFFYNPNAVAPSVPLTRDAIITKLTTLLGSDVIDKKTYRTAALKYHPDRNGGDGSKMSELNMLWRMYNG
jgi:hypothetical protein